MFANEAVYKPHRDFVKRLRENMWAIVEICFGEAVWKEVEASSQVILFPL
jgi:hypothetical protein